MVRLKDALVTGTLTCSIVFQFQYGAIKSANVTLKDNPYMLFQFQYGAIKSYNNFYILSINTSISIPVWCD